MSTGAASGSNASPVKTKTKRKRAVVLDDSRSVNSELKKPKKEAEISPFHMDDEEIEKTDAYTHLDEFLSASSSISEAIGNIRELKQTESQGEEIEKLKEECLLKFISIKKLNRLSHIRCKTVRDVTTQAKEKMDGFHLQLQNLLYEASHLQKEISKCLDFRSKDEEIELVPLEDFIKDAPPEISKVDDPQSDDHKLKLARLDWELEQRKRLSLKLKEIEKERDLVSEEIQKKHDQLDGLEPKLNQILETTKPVQSYLDLPFDKTLENHEKASHLPAPLYVLYMQITAYQEACDKKIEVSLDGDMDAAKDFSNLLPLEDADSESESEETEKKTSKRRRKTVEDKLVSAKDRVFRKHPLYVSVIIKCKDKNSLTLTFEYLTQLKVTSVKVKVNISDKKIADSSFVTELLSNESLLTDLYPNDSGTAMLNPSSQYHLTKLGEHKLTDYISDVGHIYHWAQWLCGVQFLPDLSDDNKPVSSTSGRHMRETIHRLRSRVSARLCLLRQFQALNEKQLTVNKRIQHLFPAKVVSQLASWTVSSFDHFQTLPHTKAYCEAGLATESCLFFSLTADRQSAKMTCEVVIPPNYPASPSQCVVSLKWQGKDRTSFNDYYIHSMEMEVNGHWKELVQLIPHEELVTNQIRRLLMCMDVYLETEDLIDGEETEMPRNHIYPKLARGPLRSKPFKYNNELGFFTQR